MNQQNRILIIEDHEIIRWALISIIEDNFPDYHIDTAPTLDHGISLLEKNTASMVVLDIDVPGGNNPMMIEMLRNVQPGVKILIHTATSEEEGSLKYLVAGADGFLSKSAPFETIEKAFSAVLAGDKYMSQQTQNIFAQRYLKNLSCATRIAEKIKLTPRETEITNLLLSGKWTKEIADELGIKWSTVSTHKLRIFEKFDVTNEIQLYQKVEKEMPELINRKNPGNAF